MKKDKIEKLIAHEKSARELGNTNEADAFQKKIRQLRDKDTEVKDKKQNQARWQCSCGYELVLSLDDSAGNLVFVEIMLAPHRGYGHNLELIN